MKQYEKMYHVTFNAITDALEIVQGLPEGREKLRILTILETAQLQTEELYLQQTEPESALLCS